MEIVKNNLKELKLTDKLALDQTPWKRKNNLANSG